MAVKALDKMMDLLGKPSKNKILSLEELVAMRALCARAMIDCNNFQNENETLIKENAKMTKHQVMFKKTIKNLHGRIKELLQALKWCHSNIEYTPLKKGKFKVNYRKVKTLIKKYK